MTNHREEIILGMKDMVADLERKGFTGNFSSDREAITGGYVMGMLADGIARLEAVRPEQAEEIELVFEKIVDEVRSMRGKNRD